MPSVSAQHTPVFNWLDQCAGKRCYRRRRDAMKAKRQVQTAWGGVRLVVYVCPHCGWHHLGNMSTAEPKRGYVERW